MTRERWKELKIHGAAMWKTIAMYFQNVLLLCIRITFLWLKEWMKRVWGAQHRYIYTHCVCFRMNWTGYFCAFCRMKKVHTFTFCKNIYPLFMHCRCTTVAVYCGAFMQFVLFFLLALIQPDSLRTCVCLCASKWSAVGMRYEYVRNIVQYF